VEQGTKIMRTEVPITCGLIDNGTKHSNPQKVTEQPITYNDVLNGCKDLISLVQNDQDEMKCVLSTITEWSNHLRASRCVYVAFLRKDLKTSTNDHIPINERQPLPAITKQHYFQNRDKRFKSMREHIDTSNTTKRPKVALVCNDTAFVSGGSSKSIRKTKQYGSGKMSISKKHSKTCQLCAGHGHIKEKCDYLCKDGIYGKGMVCALIGMEMRESLFNDINMATNFIKQRPKDCTKIVLQSMPKKIRALQIHNKYFIQNTDTLSQIDISNVCVECTILNEG